MKVGNYLGEIKFWGEPLNTEIHAPPFLNSPLPKHLAITDRSHYINIAPHNYPETTILMSKQEPSLAENTARVKSIYIELPGYEYFHSPSGINRKDDRFIGREAIIKRLKTILNNSKTRAGAYLITGYRGMGKTSLVRKVIADQKENCTFSTGWVANYAFHCLFFLMLLGLLGYLILSFTNLGVEFDAIKRIEKIISFLWPTWLRMLVGALTIVGFYWFLQNTTQNLRRYSFHFFIFIATIAFLTFVPMGDSLEISVQDSEYRISEKSQFSQKIIGFLFIGNSKVLPPFVFFLVLLFILIGIQARRWKGEWGNLWWNWVISKAAKAQVLSVEISLSQDDLGEKDFLRLLAKKIHQAFEGFNRPAYSFLKLLIRANFLLIFLLFFFIFFSSLAHFYFRIPEMQTEKLLNVSVAQNETKLDKDLDSSKTSALLFDQLDVIELYVKNQAPLGYQLKRSSGEGVTYSALERSVFFNKSLWPVLFVILAIIYYFLVSLLLKGSRRLKRYLGITSYQTIHTRLNALVSKIEANIVLEQSQGGSAEIPKAGLSITSRKTQHFPIAGPKEIEFELIDILNAIDETPFFWKSIPRFICVFDELDKIHLTHYPSSESTNEKESNLNKSGSAPSGLLRNRREKISNILANLKHFLNVAKAKFIFIAGREMFDASLADISDRDFFLGSIFHDIIYVDSFLKDKTTPNSHGITNMVEAYLCKLLIGENEKKYPFNLKGFYQSLKQTATSPEIGYREELRAQKAIATLQNFIIYLVYRSNGTPKKLTQLIENQIINISHAQGERKFSCQNILILKKGSAFNDIHMATLEHGRVINPRSRIQKSSFFLYFSHQDQYQIGLTSYLYRPYLIASSQFTKSFGDKLLFSTSFIVDHLFKFHPWAFSWKTLELTPEIVFANTSPELRTYIGRLVAFLLQSQMREIVYGVFEFKFFNKIRNEIAYISKIKEAESAAYNFTLDESQPVKRHFRTRLFKLIEQGRLHPSRKEGEYHHSIAFIHSTLGDLHFYDQEFDEALVEYSEAVAIQSRTMPAKVTPHQLTNWMKDRLKVGLVYERMRSNDDAYAKYEGLLMDMEQFFQQDVNPDSDHNRTQFAKSLFENLRFFQLPFLARLVMIEKEGISGLSYFDIYGSEARMKAFLTRCLQAAPSTSKQWSFFNKEQGETQEFLVRSYYHLNVGAVLYFKNGAVLHAHDELKEDDKNLWKGLQQQLILKTGNKFPDPGYKVPRGATIEYYKAFLFLAGRMQAFSEERGGNIRKRPDPSPNHVEHDTREWIKQKFAKALATLNNKTDKQGELKDVFEWINDGLKPTSTKGFQSPIPLVIAVSTWFYLLPSRNANFINKDKNLRSTIAQVLSKFGDTLLCYQGERVSFASNKWKALFRVKSLLLNQKAPSDDMKRFRDTTHLNLKSFLETHMKLEEGSNLIYYTCYFYLLSGLYYQSAGKHQSHELQLRKILYVVKEYLTFGIGPTQISGQGSSFFTLLKKHLFTPAIQAITKTNNVATRPQIFKFKSTFQFEKGTETKKHESKILYQFLSNYPESRELSLLMAEIEFKLKYKDSGMNNLSFNAHCHPVNPYNTIASKFVRMQELNFKASSNFRQVFEEKERKQPSSKGLVKKLRSELNNLTKILSYLEGKITSIPLNTINQFRTTIEKYIHSIIELIDSLDRCEYPESRCSSIKGSGESFRPILFAFIHNYVIKSGSIIELWDSNSKQPELLAFFKQFTLSKHDSIQYKKTRLVPKKLLTSFPTSQFEYYLIDSLFCLTELVKIQNIFGQNYITSHSYLGYSHAKLGDWCLIYQAYIIALREKQIPNPVTGEKEIHTHRSIEEFETKLKSYIETTNLAYLEPKYHYEKAVMAFKSAVEMHNNGNAYYQQLQTMHFLEDDFNDNMYHFTAAMERYKLNLGAIRKKIKVLRSFMNLSKTYKYESYINTQQPHNHKFPH